MTTTSTRAVPAHPAVAGSVDLSAAPFHLDDAAIAWVHQTLASMDTHAKISQLFCLVAMNPDPAALQAELSVVEPCGYMLRPLPGQAVEDLHRLLQSHAKIPMLLAANLEKGADGLIAEGTSFASPLQVAATDNEDNAYRMGVATGREARALGGNWGFAPLCDIQFNPANPITNTRCFGSDANRVARMTSAFVKGLQEQGVAASPKHFPGDGVDDRDQHLVTSVNTLSVDEWDATFGMVYSRLINEGTKTIMAAHIAQPAYSKALNPDLRDEDILPASLSPELLGGLLRGKLGFNGVIATDATLMSGFTIPMPRAQAVPSAIAAGCDVFLFTEDLATDVQYMTEGLTSGILTQQRLDEAVTRILALKASLGLHEATPEELVPGTAARQALPLAEHRAWAAESANAAITLVKNLDGVLPLDPAKIKRVLIYSIADQGSQMMAQLMGGGSTVPPAQLLAGALKAAGIQATVFERPTGLSIENLMSGADSVPRTRLIADYDAVIYLAQMQPASNAPVIRLTWAPLTAGDSPKYLAEIPTIFISLGSPFHLQDVPRIRTFVNAYGETPATVDAVAAKLLGDSPFTGTSPVDPFCGYWDARL